MHQTFWTFTHRKTSILQICLLIIVAFSCFKLLDWSMCECRLKLRHIVPITRGASFNITIIIASSLRKNLLIIELFLYLMWVQFTENLVWLHGQLLHQQNFFEHLFISCPSRYLSSTHISNFFEILETFVPWLTNKRILFIVQLNVSSILELSVTTYFFTIFFWH